MYLFRYLRDSGPEFNASVRPPLRRWRERDRSVRLGTRRSTFPQPPTPRRTAISRGRRTHEVGLCDQREARHCWFRQPASARAQSLTVLQFSYNGLTRTSHRGRSVSAASGSSPQAMHRPLLRSSLLPATRSRPRSCLCQFRTTP